MSAGELKPCPFCGCAVTDYSSPYSEPLIAHPVGKGYCPCAGKILNRAAWNQRTDPTRDALLEALEGLLHGEIAHVGPFAGQKVVAARATLALAQAEAGK